MKIVSLCGRNSFQITPRGIGTMRLDELASRLENSGEVKRNEWLLRFTKNPYEMTVFRDGRTIVKGVPDASTAKNLFAKLIGY
jgi:molybdopterin-synthase adenylyltransferase